MSYCTCAKFIDITYNYLQEQQIILICNLQITLTHLMNFFFHFGLEIKKLLTKLSKEKGMEAIGRWKKACVCHFYWCVTSTQAKLQQVILAKFRSFQYHILNQHTNIPERLFNKCAHGGVTTQRLWLTKGNSTAIQELLTTFKPALTYLPPSHCS